MNVIRGQKGVTSGAYSYEIGGHGSPEAEG
jgi:hypothetical protein